MVSLAALIVWAANAIALAQPSSDWLEFRNNGGTSSIANAELPTEWDVATGENVAWRAELPGRGVSSPIVVGNRVFVTASGGLDRAKLHVLAFDVATGKQVWHRTNWATGRTQCHPTSANAAPTPASDGQRVFAFFSSNDLACYDLGGNLLWYRGLVLDHPRLGNDVGMSSSPVVGDGVVVVLCECQGDSFAAGIDCQTGKTLWEVPRPQGANWVSPVITQMTYEDQTVGAVILQSSNGLTIHALSDGKQLWTSNIRGASIPSPMALEGMLLAPGAGLTAVKINSAGEPQVLWQNGSMQPGNPSPIIADDLICVINRAGVLMLADRATGEIRLKKRIGGSYWATPVAVGKRLYALDDRGNMNVVDLSQNGEIVAKNSFGADEETLGSPAVAGNALYVRSHNYLWKIAQSAE
jgi:outer membrane protein assembly factor BamB